MPLPVVLILGIANSAKAYELRDFMLRNGSNYSWQEIASDDDARAFAGVDSMLDSRLPICKLQHGSVLFNPSIQELASALLWYSKPKLASYDLAIFGAGPAGLSAAVYGASEGLKTIVIERSAVGGQASSSSRIENYLGFPDGVSGWELAARARIQAQRLGAEIIIADEAIENVENSIGVTYLASGTRIVARAVICATGIDYNRLGLPEEERLLGHGLYYGAGSSEAGLCTGRVIVVGGGNSAGQAALNFANHGRQVTMLVRGISLANTLSTYLVDRIIENDSIDVLLDTVVTRLVGNDSVRALEYRSGQAVLPTRVETRNIFVCIGGSPHTSWAGPLGIATDSKGYILTGSDLRDANLSPRYWKQGQRPCYLQTSVPTMFAAGDVRHNSVKRCATAVGDGATAVSMVHNYLSRST
jgi:thioredoxin reductase (NADPH)